MERKCDNCLNKHICKRIGSQPDPSYDCNDYLNELTTIQISLPVPLGTTVYRIMDTTIHNTSMEVGEPLVTYARAAVRVKFTLQMLSEWNVTVFETLDKAKAQLGGETIKYL